MRKVQVLSELQRVDSALDQARERLAAVEAQLADRTALAAVEAEHAAADKDLQRRSAEQRDLELEVEDLRQKLAALEKKLYSGTVQNPKELNDMANEATQYRKLISAREDRLIPLYDVVEAAQRAADEAASRLAETQGAHRETQARLVSERESLRAAIGEQEQQRALLEQASDAQSLRLYESLRRTRAGLAVAEVAQRTCQGCRVTLPVSEEMRARSSEDLVMCQSCGRILHAGR